MKKILYIISAVVISLSLCIGIAAEEMPEVEDTLIVIEDVAENADEITTDGVAEENPTIFTRLKEYAVTYKTEILGAAGDVALLVLAVILKKRVASVKGDTSLTGDSQKSVVNAVNGMIDGYNALRESYDKYGLTEDDRNRVVGALVAQNTAILEILTTITVNNKNTPQGVKDIAMLKYANCLKTLEDDEQLKAIVTSVRESIGTTLIVEEETAEEDSTTKEE